MEFEIGQIIKMKKKHPCGSDQWEIMRVGADFRLKCMGCGHQIMAKSFCVCIYLFEHRRSFVCREYAKVDASDAEVRRDAYFRYTD